MLYFRRRLTNDVDNKSEKKKLEFCVFDFNDLDVLQCPHPFTLFFVLQQRDNDYDNAHGVKELETSSGLDVNSPSSTV